MLSLCRDDLPNDGPPVTDKVFSYWPWHNPFHLPSLSEHVRCCPNSNMDHVLPPKFRNILLSELNSVFRLVNGIWEGSFYTVGW